MAKNFYLIFFVCALFLWPYKEATALKEFLEGIFVRCGLFYIFINILFFYFISNTLASVLHKKQQQATERKEKNEKKRVK